MIADINTILLPTDFSQQAQNAYPYAVKIAQKHNATVCIMHSVKQPYSYGSEQMMREIIKHNTTKNVYLDTAITYGNTVEDILSRTCDLIVLSKTGHSNTRKLFFGSTSTKVITHSPVPVLLVPGDQPFKGFNQFIFATDYHKKDLELLAQLTEWAQHFEATVTVLHIGSEQNLETEIKFRGFKETVNEKIEYPRFNFSLIIRDDFFDGLSSFLGKKTKKMIVMPRGQKTLLQSFTEQNHIRQTIPTEVPMLILPENEAHSTATDSSVE